MKFRQRIADWLYWLTIRIDPVKEPEPKMVPADHIGPIAVNLTFECIRLMRNLEFGAAIEYASLMELNAVAARQPDLADAWKMIRQVIHQVGNEKPLGEARLH